MIFVAEHGSVVFGWTERTETLHVGHTAPDAYNSNLARPKASSELSTRELEVLTRLVEGQSNPEISVSLGVTPDTVKFHVENVFKKLGAKNRVVAAVLAVRRGLVP